MGAEPLSVCVIAHTVFASDGRVRREAECLAERGDRVDVFCLRQEEEPSEEVFNNIHLYRIKRYRKPLRPLAILGELFLFLVLSCLQTTLHFWRKRYRVIHVHTIPDFAVFAALIPKLCGASIILDMHETMPELFMRKFGVSGAHWMVRILKVVERLSARLADHVIVATPFCRETVIQRSVSADKCTAVLNLPDSKYFHRRGTAQADGPGGFKLVYPGTLSEHHGVDVAIRAIAQVRARGDIPLEFHIYGFGPERERLISLTKKLKLEDVVRFHAEVPIEQLARVLRSMDVGLVPKKGGTFADEAMSTKLFEFAALGLPVIASRTTGDSLYFNDSMVSFFEPGNERELAKSIVKLYRDPQYRQGLVMNSQRVFESVSWESEKTSFYAIVDRVFPPGNN